MPKMCQNTFGGRALPGSAGSAPPDPLAAMGGLLLRERGGEIEEGRGRVKGSGGENKGEEGTRGRNGPSHFLGQVYAHVETWHCPPSVHLRHLNAEERKDV